MRKSRKQINIYPLIIECHGDIDINDMINEINFRVQDSMNRYKKIIKKLN